MTTRFKPRRLHHWLSVFGLLAVMSLPAAVCAEEAPAEPASVSWTERIDEVGGAAYDLSILRPYGVLRLAVGGVAMVPVAALGWPGGLESLRYASDFFVVLPYEDVFDRPIGAF